MWISTSDNNHLTLYGGIYEGEGPLIVDELTRFFQSTPEPIVNLHSPGGSVFDGILISNTIAGSSLNTTCYIVGLAASMGAVISQSFKKVYMASNAFLMFHFPSGSVEGTAEQIEVTAAVMRELEAIFVALLVKRTGKTEADIKAWLVGDKWFTAEQALAAGLIDGIIDPVLEVPTLEAWKQPRISASHFAEYELKNQPQPEQQNTIPYMKLTAQSQLAIKATSAEVTDAEANQAIETLAATNETLAAENKRLKEADEKRKEEEQKALEQKAETKVNACIQEGRILAGDKEKYKGALVQNYDLTAEMLDKFPAKVSIAAHADRSSGQPSITAGGDRSAWTMSDWMEKDLPGLHALKRENPAVYASLPKNHK